MTRPGRPDRWVAVAGACFAVGTVAAMLRPGWFVADVAPILAAMVLAARAAALSGERERPAWLLFTAGLATFGLGEIGGPVMLVTAIAAPVLVSAGAIRLAWCAGAFANVRTTLNTLMSIASVVAITLVVAPTAEMTGRPTLQGDMLVVWLTNAIPLTLLAGIMVTIALQMGPRRVPWAVGWAAALLLVLAVVTATVMDSGTDAAPALPDWWTPAAQLAIWATLAVPPLWVVVTGRGLTTGLPPLGDSDRVAVWAVATAVGALLLGVALLGVDAFPAASVVAPVLLLVALARVAWEAGDLATLAASRAEAAEAAERAATESRAGEADVLAIVHDVLNSLYAVMLAVESVDVGDDPVRRAAVAEASAAYDALGDRLRGEYANAADEAAHRRGGPDAP